MIFFFGNVWDNDKYIFVHTLHIHDSVGTQSGRPWIPSRFRDFYHVNKLRWVLYIGTLGSMNRTRPPKLLYLPPSQRKYPLPPALELYWINSERASCSPTSYIAPRFLMYNHTTGVSNDSPLLLPGLLVQDRGISTIDSNNDDDANKLDTQLPNSHPQGALLPILHRPPFIG